MRAARSLLVALLLGASTAVGVPLAHAAFADPATAGSGFATAQLSAPTGLAATRTCTVDVLGTVLGASVAATWTPGSAWATGQRVELRNALGVLVDAEDLGPTASAATLTVPLLSLSSSYALTVRATYAGWRSPAASRTVPGC